MEQLILCENKSFKLFILFKNRINVWSDKVGLLPHTWGKKHMVLIQLLKQCFLFLIMSKLILVQNNHFSQVWLFSAYFEKIQLKYVNIKKEIFKIQEQNKFNK